MSIFRTSIILIIIFTVITGIIHPISIFALGQIVFPTQANGNIIVINQQKIGSELIGQQFESDRYFHSRPSVNDYDASNSGGSNYGPMNSDFLAKVDARIEKIKQEDPDYSGENIPSDMVTTSGSGLDPHISIENAYFQTKRISQTRGITEDEVKQLIEKNKEEMTLGLWGQPRVNVLKLNLDLDKVK